MKTIYYNGRVYTGGPVLMEAFGVDENGLFAAVGRDMTLLASADEDDALVDLSGRFVCAGFNDSHLHLLNLGQTLSQAPLMLHTTSLSDVMDCMRAQLKAHPPKKGGWLMGRGWNQDFFTDERRMPTRRDLDKISEDIPILITRACGHCCCLNSKALSLAGIDADTPSPQGGTIGMENGEPNGLLFDNAMDIALACVPLPDKAELKRMLRLAIKKLNSCGITSAQTDDYCVFREIDYELINEAYRELEASGELTVRVYEQCNFTEPEALSSFINAGNMTGVGSELFKIGPLKLLGDGALGSRTAHLSMPYRDSGDNCGFSLFSQEKMNELVKIANDNGMQIAVHAIGDACLDRVLEAIELALRARPRRDHRHGIVHCQITREDQLEKIIKLGLHIYAQTVFLDYDNHIVTKLVPPELSKTSYGWKTLMKGGACVSNGSDCPVEPPDVMRGVECALTRRSLDGTGPFRPEEAFTVSEALDSFTSCGARASFEEKIKGRIEKGCLADFVILSGDPFETAPDALHTLFAVETYLGGKCVYSAE